MPPTPILLNTTFGPVIQIGCGYDFTCALFQQGAVACWGSNQYGQLGIDSAASSESQMPPEFVPWNLTAPGTPPLLSFMLFAAMCTSSILAPVWMQLWQFGRD